MFTNSHEHSMFIRFLWQFRIKLLPWKWKKQKLISGNTKGGSITVPLNSCLESAVWHWQFCFYLENRLIQTSQTGGQEYSNTSPFSIPCLFSLSFFDNFLMINLRENKQDPFWFLRPNLERDVTYLKNVVVRILVVSGTGSPRQPYRKWWSIEAIKIEGEIFNGLDNKSFDGCIFHR